MNNNYQAKQAVVEQGYASRSLRADTSPEVIREAGPIGKARETLGYLADLEMVNADMRRKLYGPFPEEGQAIGKNAPEPSLEEMLTLICQRTAMAVGDAKNLLSKLE